MEKKLILVDDEVDEYLNWEKDKDNLLDDAYTRGEASVLRNHKIIAGIVGFIIGFIIGFILIILFVSTG